MTDEVLPSPNDKRKQCIGGWLRLFAETKIQNAEEELTEQRLRAYEFELREVPTEKLDGMFLRASKVLKFFPKPVELLDFLPDPEAHARAYAALQTRYVQAYLAGGPPKSLPSVLEPAPTVETFKDWHHRVAVKQGWIEPERAPGSEG